MSVGLGLGAKSSSVGGTVGGVFMDAAPLEIGSTLTGVVAQLSPTGLGGTLTYSLVSGTNATINSSTGAISFTTTLASGSTRTIVARVSSSLGMAFENTFTFTGITVGGTVSLNLNNNTVASTWSPVTVGTITVTNGPAGSFVRIRDEDAGFAIVEG
jgi:hypothetical protein